MSVVWALRRHDSRDRTKSGRCVGVGHQATPHFDRAHQVPAGLRSARRAIEIVSNRVWCLGAVAPPPLRSRANLLCCLGTDDDLECLAPFRLRSSGSSCFSGIVSPSSHCAIASRSTFSVAGSASKVSSSSRAITVTEAPSGSSPSSSIRPSTTFPRGNLHTAISSVAEGLVNSAEMARERPEWDASEDSRR